MTGYHAFAFNKESNKGEIYHSKEYYSVIKGSSGIFVGIDQDNLYPIGFDWLFGSW